MHIHADKTSENKSQALTNSLQKQQNSDEPTFQVVDNRPEAITQRKLREIIDNSSHVRQLKAFQKLANNSLQVKQLKFYQAMADHFTPQSLEPQEKVEEEAVQGKFDPIQKKENNTGLPDNLKSGIENLSGSSINDVEAHSNPDKPTPLYTYAQAEVRRNKALQMKAADSLFSHTSASNHVTQLKPEIAATDAAVGTHIVDKMTKDMNSIRTHNSGVHYAHNYERYASQYNALDPNTNQYKPFHDFWQDDYRNGYAPPQYFDRLGFMSWKLKDGKSASEAIKAWIKGVTIAECLTTIYASQTDALRASLGDENFDYLYGTLPSSKPKLTDNEKVMISIGDPYAQYMPIKQYHSNTELTDEVLTKGDSEGTRGKIGQRPVKKGEWYYFYNHPKYLLRHPGGAFQGENALFIGEENSVQYWEGFGVTKCTEDVMMNTIRSAYNAERNEADYRVLIEIHGLGHLKTGGKSYEVVYNENLNSIQDQYRHDKGLYPDSVSVNDILTAPSYTLDGTTRTGGFLSTSGVKVDSAKIKNAFNAAVVERWNTNPNDVDMMDYKAATDNAKDTDKEAWVKAAVGLPLNYWDKKSTPDLLALMDTIDNEQVWQQIMLHSSSRINSSRGDELKQLRIQINTLKEHVNALLDVRRISWQVTNTKHSESGKRNTFKIKVESGGKSIENGSWIAPASVLNHTVYLKDLVNLGIRFNNSYTLKITITEWGVVKNGYYTGNFDLFNLKGNPTIGVDKFSVSIFEIIP